MTDPTPDRALPADPHAGADYVHTVTGEVVPADKFDPLERDEGVYQRRAVRSPVCACGLGDDRPADEHDVIACPIGRAEYEKDHPCTEHGDACPDEWQPAHPAGSHPDHCRTCSAAAVYQRPDLPGVAPGALPAAAVSDVAPLTFDDVKHLFDLAVDTPLVCSGSFDTDDVNVLRRVAVFLGTDPNAITPDEFVSQYPHPHKPRPVHDRTLKVNDNRQSGYGMRDETAEETTARVAEERADLTCWAGPYVRRCGKLADDPIHTGDGVYCLHCRRPHPEHVFSCKAAAAES